MSSSFTPKRDEVAASSADEVELRRGRRDRLGGVKADDLGGIEAFGLIVPLIRRLLNVLVASDDPMRKTHDRGSLMKMSVRLGSTIALVVLATAGLIYVAQSRRTEGVSGHGTQVVVSTEDIPANTPLDRYIERGVFTTVELPTSALVAGAITSVSELRGQRTAATIYANEQIPTSRLAGPACRPPDVTHVVFGGGFYVRDVGQHLVGSRRYEPDTSLPRSAVRVARTAGRSVLVVPHVDPGPAPFVYVRFSDHVERWPLYTFMCD